MKTVFLGILFFTNALLAQQYTNPMSINLKVGLTHPGSNWPGCNLNATAAGIKLTDLNPAFKPGVSIWLQSAGDFEVEIPNSLNVPYSRHTGFDYVTTQGLKSIVCTNPIDPFLIECIGPRESTLTASVAALTIPENHDYIYLAPYRAYCTVATDVENDYRISGTVRFIDEVIKNITIIQDGIEIPSGPSLISVKLERPLQFKLELTPGMDMLDSELYACRKKINHTFTNSGDGNVYVNVAKLDAFDCEYDSYVQFKLKGNTTSGQNIQVGERIFYFNIFRQLEGDFYQVIKNPILNSPSTIVDLVAGKNADFILKAIPLMDATNAKLEIRDENNSVLISYDATAAKANENGEIFFQLDPVPSTYGFTNKNLTAKAYVKSSSNSSERYYEVSREFVIRKTKPIKLKFLKIISPPGDVLYASPSNESMQQTIVKGSEFAKRIFPIADSDFTVDQTISTIIGTKKENEYYEDYKKIKNLQENALVSFFEPDNTQYIALTTAEYMQYVLKRPVSGFTIFELPHAFVRAGAVRTVAHELLHTFGITFPNSDVDPLINRHYLSMDSLTDSIYSNYSSILLDTSRGYLQNRYHLMTIKAIEGISQENGYWLDEQSYLQLFRKSLVNRNTFKTNIINLFGKIRATVAPVIDSIYLFKKIINRPNFQNRSLVESNYFANIKNSKDELVRSLSLPVKQFIIEEEAVVAENNDSFIDENIDIGGDGFYIDVLKNVSGKSVLVQKIVIPTDLILYKLNDIAIDAFILNRDVVVSKMRDLLYEAREKLILNQIDLANNILTNKFYPYINSSLTSNFKKKSAGDLGLLEIQNLFKYSKSKLDSIALNRENPFVIFQVLNAPLIGERSEIKVDFINQPSNSEYIMVYDLFFDGLLVQTVFNQKFLFANSGLLQLGKHNWQIRTFVVNRRLWQGYLKLISDGQVEINRHILSLQTETDLSIIHEINEKILKIEQKISYVEAKKDALKKEVSKAFNHQFEVK